VRFDAAFAQLTPQAFIDRILLQGLGIRYLVVGHDFRFGHRREGDFALLQAAATAHGFVVESLAPFCVGSERVSSSRIRAALATGDMEEAERLLGRTYRISGRVAGGRKLGRELGVPTANLPLQERRALRYGVYAARVNGAGGKGMMAAVSLGTRPTVAGEDCVLEVHLLDFDRDVYGERLEVQLLRFLRPEERFASLEALRQQMTEDIRQARAWLQERK
jgi:riboflavin kinase/FMN adenylyltransferase